MLRSLCHVNKKQEGKNLNAFHFSAMTTGNKEVKFRIIIRIYNTCHSSAMTTKNKGVKFTGAGALSSCSRSSSVFKGIKRSLHFLSTRCTALHLLSHSVPGGSAYTVYCGWLFRQAERERERLCFSECKEYPSEKD